MSHSHLFDMLTVSSETESRTNSEADTQLSGYPYERDIQTLIHRNRPNRPHISSVLFNCQKASETKTNQMRPKLSARPACSFPKILIRLSSLTTTSAHQHNLNCAGEGGSTDSACAPQPLFFTFLHFLWHRPFSPVFWGLRDIFVQ